MSQQSLLLRALICAICCTSSFISIAQSSSEECLVAWYHLNQNLRDTGVQNLHGSSSVVQYGEDQLGAQNEALVFDSIAGFAKLGSDFDYAQRTANIWFKSTPATAEQFILSIDHPGLQHGMTKFQLHPVGAELFLRFKAGLAQWDHPIVDSSWYMGTIVVDSGMAYFYLNAQLVATQGLTPAKSSNGDTLAILGASRLLDRNFRGSVSDVRMYPCALDSCQIYEIFDATAPIQTTAAHYALKGNAQDSSLHALHGSTTNTTTVSDYRHLANEAILFDGSSSHIELGSDFDALHRSVNIWFRSDSSGTQQQFLLAIDHPQLQHQMTKFQIEFPGGQRHLRYKTGSAIHDEPIVEGRWYMATITANGYDTRYYLDGQHMATLPYGSNTSASGPPVGILGASRLYNRHFSGAVADIKFYTRALSACEIHTVYSNDTIGMGSDTSGSGTSNLLPPTRNESPAPVVYPNPASNQLLISEPVDYWKIFDLRGRQLLEGKADIIDVTSLSKGIYVICLHQGQLRHTQRLVVQ